MQSSDAQLRRGHGPKVGSWHRHYKGGRYRVIENAVHESTLEHLVIYQDEGGNTWARPLDDWSATVEVHGVPQPRFAPEENTA